MVERSTTATPVNVPRVGVPPPERAMIEDRKRLILRNLTTVAMDLDQLLLLILFPEPPRLDETIRQALAELHASAAIVVDAKHGVPTYRLV